MSITHNEQDLTLRVKAMTWESEGVLSVHLQQLDGSPLPDWDPGSHLDLKLPGVITRQYSLNSSPTDTTTWRISVLRELVSKGGSQAVHERLRTGDVVDVRGPRNNFPLIESPNYLFIAGGIGITPILPMIEAATASGANWRMVYGGRTRESMAFLTELERYGDAVDVHPQDEMGLLDLPGLLDTPREETLVYCCGPERLLESVEERCTQWPPGALHVERFAAKVREPVDPIDESAFEVFCARSETRVTVPAGKAILECLESAGLSPEYSCREGICGTCETRVLEGVPDHRDSILSDEEKSANDMMMICVGRALSPRLVLDI
jgi:ferredoxin-NADP reductase